MKILILDDMQERHEAFSKKYKSPAYKLTHVISAKKCIEALEDEEFDMVCLDHDLGGKTFVTSGENTGYEVCEWITNNVDKVKDTPIVIHSYNPVGAKNMAKKLAEVKVYAFVLPGFWASKDKLF